MTLVEILTEVRALTVEQQRQLRDAIGSLLSSTGTPLRTEQEFEEHLAGLGLITATRSVKADAGAFAAWEPVPVVGKPVSETIVEERG